MNSIRIAFFVAQRARCDIHLVMPCSILVLSHRCECFEEADGKASIRFVNENRPERTKESLLLEEGDGKSDDVPWIIRITNGPNKSLSLF
jgi:hypothetical protein